MSPDAIDPAFVGDPIPFLAPKTSATAVARSKKGHSYKSLPTRFRRGGFNHRQIAREGNAAIYEQTWSGCHNPSVCYEVIYVRRRDRFKIDNRWVEPAEIYPNSEAWGTDGFTFTDKDAAFAKLREIAASFDALARFGQKRKRSRLEKSPT